MLELILVSVAAGGLTAHLLSSERVTTGGVSVFFGLIGAMGVDALVNRNHVIFGSNADMVRAAVSAPAPHPHPPSVPLRAARPGFGVAEETYLRSWRLARKCSSSCSMLTLVRVMG
jgi:hypothetical protein